MLRSRLKQLIGTAEVKRIDLGNKPDKNEIVASLGGGDLFGDFDTIFANPSAHDEDLDWSSFINLTDKSQKIIFYEFIDKPKKLNQTIKYLLKFSKIESFPLLRFGQLDSKIKELAKGHNVYLSSSQLETLAAISDGRLSIADNILKQLSVYLEGQSTKTITDQEFYDIAGFDVSGTIFSFVEALAHGNAHKSHSLLNKLITAGESEIYVLTMIVWQYRQLIIAKAMLDAGRSRTQISTEAGIRLFALDKTLSLLDRYSLDKLKKIYARLLDAEISIKSGRTDPKTLLDLLVFGLAK